MGLMAAQLGRREPVRPLGIATLMGILGMPLWLEILINVGGYAGFIAIAMSHKSGKDEGSDKI